MVAKFRVSFVGSFYAGELYDAGGCEVFDCMEAAECAEDQYGSDWDEVYNGEDGISRDDWLADGGVETIEPVEGDFTITPTGPLGGLSGLGRVDMGYVGEFGCDDCAIREAQRIMTVEQWWTNIWIVSDHGNWMLWEGCDEQTDGTD